MSFEHHESDVEEGSSGIHVILFYTAVVWGDVWASVDVMADRDDKLSELALDGCCGHLADVGLRYR